MGQQMKPRKGHRILTLLLSDENGIAMHYVQDVIAVKDLKSCDAETLANLHGIAMLAALRKSFLASLKAK